MLKIFGLCISFLVLGITVGLPTKDIDELIYRLEELKQQNHYDEPYDRFNIVRPSALENFDDNDEILLRNVDGYGRNIGTAYRSYNLADDLDARRYYLEHKFNNLHPVQQQQHQQIQSQQQHEQLQQQQKQQQQQQQPLSNAQNQLKRAIDSIGGANLLKRAVDRIGGGHLLKRR